MSKSIEADFQIARERFAEQGVDVDAALRTLGDVSISVHCWQGDDVGGFETPEAELSGGGIQVTGNYPGKARTPDELRQDLEQAYALIPGSHRLNLHAMYGEFGGKTVDRDEIGPEHFAGWVDWGRAQDIPIDFNATCFSHELADSGFTLSHPDADVRAFWVRHVQRCREISAYLGRELGSPCMHNLWIPDGFKDLPADRWGPRARLIETLDEIYSVKQDRTQMRDAVECKLFGLGSEAYVVGSHEFYLSYALTRGIIPCFDMGHFHPTEQVADKLSAVLPFSGALLLHVSRGVRWDSDHVVIVNDELRSLCEEIVRSGRMSNITIALDFFDASMHRVGAWTIGTRATLFALLQALLQPVEKLMEYESKSDYFARLATLELSRALPVGAIWDYFCLTNDVPAGTSWIDAIHRYEAEVSARRS